MKHYPGSNFPQDYFDYPRGENSVDTLLKMTALKGFAENLQNMEYQQGTLKRRGAFIAKSTLDFSSEGVFQGLHEYIDNTDTQYILTGHNSGKVKRFVSAGTSTDVITGLTSGNRMRFESMNGAAFVCNGVDANRRIDGTASRIAGAPAKLGTISNSKTAGGLTGTWQWVVVVCIKFGGSILLRSDWSTILVDTLAAERAGLSWTASADTRTSGGYSVVYEVYRSRVGVGSPYYLVAESPTNSYSDNNADSALTATTISPLGFNGVMPTFTALTTSGQRLVGVKASEPNVLSLSNIAVTDYEMETFPADGRHEIIGPSNGPITALIGFGVKDEGDNRSDLFFSQTGSCYVLRSTDPFGSPETISGEKGVINFEAVCQHGQYLFFMSSRREIEFYGPYGLRTISGNIDTYFKGGGPRNLSGISGNQYIQLKVWSNKLLIIFRDDSAKTWGNKCLVMDLEVFDPADPKNTARFTPWVGPGFAQFLPCRNGELVLADNQNTRLLYRSTGANDSIDAVDTLITSYLWSGAILGESILKWKTINGINILSISDEDAEGILEADYNYYDEAFDIEQNLTTKDWDKVWDKSWNASPQWSAFVPISRDMVGRFFQLKITVNNESADFVYIGAAFNFDYTENPTLCVR